MNLSYSYKHRYGLGRSSQFMVLLAMPLLLSPVLVQNAKGPAVILIASCTCLLLVLLYWRYKQSRRVLQLDEGAITLPGMFQAVGVRIPYAEIETAWETSDGLQLRGTYRLIHLKTQEREFVLHNMMLPDDSSYTELRDALMLRVSNEARQDSEADVSSSQIDIADRLQRLRA